MRDRAQLLRLKLEQDAQPKATVNLYASQPRGALPLIGSADAEQSKSATCVGAPL